MSTQESPLPRTRLRLHQILDSLQLPLMHWTWQHEAARDVTQRSARLRPEDYVARDYAHRGEHLKAIEEYTRLIGASRRGDWRLAGFHWSRGESYATLGRYAEAIADYEFPPTDIDVGGEEMFRPVWRLCTLFQQSGQPERIIHALRNLIDICTRACEHPGNSRFYLYQRALARAGLKEYNEAISDCRSALNASGTADKDDISELLAALLVESRRRDGPQDTDKR